MIYSYCALGFSILLGVAGQFLLKVGARSDSPNIIAQLFTPASMVGLCFYFFAALGYMYALRKIPISVAFPMVSLSYPIIVLIAWSVFGESLGLPKAVGIALIMAGVILVNRPA